MEGQTIEQFLLEQLNKIAPGKYTVAGVLQRFKAKLRFSCNHLKGGGRRTSLQGPGKDYNLSIFTFPTGVTEIKCLYNCGLKIRSDQKDMVDMFNDLYDLPTTNYKASSEVIRPIVDPGPAPTYSDEYRRRIKESNDIFWASITKGLESGRIKPGDTVLGGVFPHPAPVEAPESAVERGIKNAFRRTKKVLAATAVVQDSVPEHCNAGLEPVKKKRKTKSRRKRGGK